MATSPNPAWRPRVLVVAASLLLTSFAFAQPPAKSAPPQKAPPQMYAPPAPYVPTSLLSVPEGF
ncbi:MAG TPA: hypothetical protein VGE76_02890, partial [Opitutaceae bacterium]